MHPSKAKPSKPVSSKSRPQSIASKKRIDKGAGRAARLERQQNAKVPERQK